MIIINTTFLFNSSIENEVLKWIRTSYQHSAIVHGATNHLLVKILGNEQPGAVSYALHLSFEDMELARTWDATEGEYLRQSLTKTWGENALSFHTYLQVVE